MVKKVKKGSGQKTFPPWPLRPCGMLPPDGMGDFSKAGDDLDEAKEIAELGSMKLYICDYHLEARGFWGQASSFHIIDKVALICH